MKKQVRIISTILMVIMIITTISSVVLASSDPGQVLDKLTGVSSVTDGRLVDFGNAFIAVVRTLGVIIAVVILLILGIKYMLGSAEERAEYKKTMVPYVVGAILIFASTAIVGIVYDLATSLNTQG